MCVISANTIPTKPIKEPRRLFVINYLNINLILLLSIQINSKYTIGKYYENGNFISNLNIPIPGLHNLSNITAAIAASRMIGVDFTEIKKNLKYLKLPKKRFEFRGQIDKRRLYDDYAHHPNEIKETIKLGRLLIQQNNNNESQKSRLVAIFQPHRYSRVKQFYEEFAEELSKADVIYVTSIYGAGEGNEDKITSKIITDLISKKNKNSIILYTIVNSKLAKYLTEKAYERNIPCFGVLGDLILNFSKVLNQKASHQPSGQHILNEEYYDRIEAIQFTMNHDDGNQTDDIEKSDIILLGVSRTSKTPTSIYLANRGFKTSNIPLVNKNSIPSKVTEKNFKPCVVGLVTEAERLYDLRKNRLNLLKEDQNSEYVNIDKIKDELKSARKLFKENNWPTIDVTRKSVEETAASVIKIYEIKNKKNA